MLCRCLGSAFSLIGCPRCQSRTYLQPSQRGGCCGWFLRERPPKKKKRRRGCERPLIVWFEERPFILAQLGRVKSFGVCLCAALRHVKGSRYRSSLFALSALHLTYFFLNQYKRAKSLRYPKIYRVFFYSTNTLKVTLKAPCTIAMYSLAISFFFFLRLIVTSHISHD